MTFIGSAADPDRATKLANIANGIVLTSTQTLIDGTYTTTTKESDPCIDASITPQSITLNSFEYKISTSQTVSAFTDSVDAAGTYATGHCGLKTITIDSPHDAILSIQYDMTNPTTSDFSITYNSASNDAEINT